MVNTIKINRVAIVLISITAFLLMLVPFVLAQDEQVGNGIKVTNIRHELTLEPGQGDQIKIKVKNVSPADYEVVSKIVNFGPDPNEGGSPKLIEDDVESPFSVKEFVEPKDRFALSAGEEVELEFSVVAPENTTPGAHFGAIQFQAVPKGAEDSDVTLNASVAPILLINVPGETTTKLELEELSVAKGDKLGSFFTSAPDKLVTRLKNSGNTFVQPFGKVTVMDWGGKEIFSFEFNDNEGARSNVLPESIRRFEDEIKNIGNFGRYKIEASIAYGDGGGQVITANSSFWVIPWYIILLVAAGIGGAGYLYFKKSGGRKTKE